MWIGRINYLTGGTTRTPRVIRYGPSRWRRSVDVTTRLLAAYGVDQRSRVAVCHPFAPWAIGQVFAEAALACGADVYPLGLSAGCDNLLRFLQGVDATHLCATARNLIRWRSAMRSGERMDHSSAPRVAFVAGEVLTPECRRLCEHAWNAKVVNVYGMAEFDTIAAEPPHSELLELASVFQYAIRCDGGVAGLAAGLTGELLIREEQAMPWFGTQDLVEVHAGSRMGAPIWGGQTAIRLLARIDDCVTLADGTLLGGPQVRDLLSVRDDLSAVQVQVTHSVEGDRILLRCVVAAGRQAPPSEELRQALLDGSIDLADSYHHGVISSISAEMVGEDDLFRTPRGKVPCAFEVDADGVTD